RPELLVPAQPRPDDKDGCLVRCFLVGKRYRRPELLQFLTFHSPRARYLAQASFTGIHWANAGGETRDQRDTEDGGEPEVATEAQTAMNRNGTTPELHGAVGSQVDDQEPLERHEAGQLQLRYQFAHRPARGRE